MSRKLYFLLTLAISGAVAYFVLPYLPTLVAAVSSERLPREFLNMLRHSDVVGIASYVSLWALVMYILAFLPLAFHVWINVSRAKTQVGTLPLACDRIHQTSKKIFVKSLERLDFIYELAIIYGDYLVQLPAREVSQEVLEKIKANRLRVHKNKKQAEKHLVEPVRALAPSAVVFAPEVLVDHRIFLWFFGTLPGVLLGLGGILLVISLTAGALLTPETYPETIGWPGFAGLMLPGLVALGYCLFTAVVLAALTRFAVALLHQNSRELSHMIDHLFHHGNWQEDLQSLSAHAASSDLVKEIEKALNRPMTALSRATKALAEDQKTRLNELLKETLVSFREEMDKSSGKQIAALTTSLEEAQKTAGLMQKSFSKSSTEFSRQMAEQAKALAAQLEDMSRRAQASEKAAEESLLHQAEALIESLKEEMGENYRTYGEFIDGHVGRVELAQESLIGALKDKDSVIQGLHKSSRDLSTIAEASGKLVDKFGKLSRELDQLLKEARSTPATARLPAGDKKLLKALESLKTQTDQRISELPDL